MTDQKLIKQLKTLKNIKPSKEWAILCKQEIMETQTPTPVAATDYCHSEGASRRLKNLLRMQGILGQAQRFFTEPVLRFSEVFRMTRQGVFFKPAFALIACFGLVLSVFGVAQGALPGDALYSAKKITEKVQLNLASEQEKPDMQVAMTSKKMQELNQVVQANLGKNLAPAIQEVEQSAQETAKTLEKLTKSVKVMNVPAETAEKGHSETAFVQVDTEKIKETLAQIQEIKSAKLVVEDVLGAKVATPELDEAVTDCYKTLVEMEIEAMENQILLQEQESLLLEIQELAAQDQYQQAFEKLLIGQ